MAGLCAKKRVPAFAVNAVDTAAAGVAFHGGFAVGLMRGYSVAESAIFASAAAAISVTPPGAQPSMPTAKEVERFLEEHSISPTKLQEGQTHRSNSVPIQWRAP